MGCENAPSDDCRNRNNEKMNPYSLGLLVSIMAYLVVGNYAGRKVKHLEDYFVAGRQAPTLLIVGTLVASLMSTNAFMGEAGLSYSGFGQVTIMLTSINAIGYVAGALFFGKYLRRSRALTLAEYFGHRFNSSRVQRVAGITIILGCTGYLMTVSQGVAAIINQVTGLSFGATLLIGWASYTLFTLYSGSRGVVITDTMMFLLFGVVSLVGLSFIVEASGGWFATIKALAVFDAKPGIISWQGMTGPDQIWESSADVLVYAIILGVAWSIVVAVSPWQASRYLMAKDEHTVVRSSVITAGVVMLLYIVLGISSAAVNLIKPDIEPAQEVMIWAAMNVMPTFAGVLMMAGIMAAGLSSASTFLSITGFSVSNDIFMRPTGQDSKRLHDSRLAMLAVSVVALALAYFTPQGYLYWIVYFVGTLFASSWGPVAFMSVWSSRITEGGAFWGIITGLAGNVGANLLKLSGLVELPTVLDPILLGAVASYITIELVSRNGAVSEREHELREQLHQTPESELDSGKLHRTLQWSKAVIVFGVLLAVLLVVFYVMPYQQAIDENALTVARQAGR
jgi:sodium/pantothenate symporter